MRVMLSGRFFSNIRGSRLVRSGATATNPLCHRLLGLKFFAGFYNRIPQFTQVGLHDVSEQHNVQSSG